MADTTQKQTEQKIENDLLSRAQAGQDILGRADFHDLKKGATSDISDLTNLAEHNKPSIKNAENIRQQNLKTERLKQQKEKTKKAEQTRQDIHLIDLIATEMENFRQAFLELETINIQRANTVNELSELSSKAVNLINDAPKSLQQDPIFEEMAQKLSDQDKTFKGLEKQLISINDELNCFHPQSQERRDLETQAHQTFITIAQTGKSMLNGFNEILDFVNKKRKQPASPKEEQELNDFSTTLTDLRDSWAEKIKQLQNDNLSAEEKIKLTQQAYQTLHDKEQELIQSIQSGQFSKLTYAEEKASMINRILDATNNYKSTVQSELNTLREQAQKASQALNNLEEDNEAYHETAIEMSQIAMDALCTAPTIDGEDNQDFANNINDLKDHVSTLILEGTNITKDLDAITQAVSTALPEASEVIKELKQLTQLSREATQFFQNTPVNEENLHDIYAAIDTNNNTLKNTADILSSLKTSPTIQSDPILNSKIDSFINILNNEKPTQDNPLVNPDTLPNLQQNFVTAAQIPIQPQQAAIGIKFG